MKRRIKKAKITFVSLCPRGKNQMPVLYKEDGSIRFDTLIKTPDDFEDKGELTAVVYAPEVRDADGDIASAEVIKQMAYDFAQGDGQLDIRHDGKALTREQAFVAEQFLVQKGDPRFQDFKDYSGATVDVTGAWAMVIKVDDPDLRTAYRDGGWNGVSLFGQAQVEMDKAADDGVVARVLDALAHRLEGRNTEEIDMTKEELLEALKTSNESLVADIAKALKSEPTADKGDDKGGDNSTQDTDDTPVFKGDPTKPEDVKAHLAKIEKAKAMKSVDWSDPEAVQKFLSTIEKDDSDDKTDKTDDGDSDEVKRLKKELAKAQGKSRQSTKDTDDEPESANLSKEEKDAFALGRKIAEISNKSRGYAPAA